MNSSSEASSTIEALSEEDTKFVPADVFQASTLTGGEYEELKVLNMKTIVISRNDRNFWHFSTSPLTSE